MFRFNEGGFSEGEGGEGPFQLNFSLRKTFSGRSSEKLEKCGIMLTFMLITPKLTKKSALLAQMTSMFLPFSR